MLRTGELLLQLLAGYHNGADTKEWPKHLRPKHLLIVLYLFTRNINLNKCLNIILI